MKIRTNQEIFNEVLLHLSTMKSRSIKDKSDNFCQYRGKSGKKCAIGHLIDDEDYHEDMDESSLTVRQLIEKYSTIKKQFERNNLDYLGKLQELHDNVSNWDSRGTFRPSLKELTGIAKTYNLVVPYCGVQYRKEKD